MFKFNNTHIFTGYLKQKLSSINIPTCKVYTQEFANYLATHGKEDPRVIESIDTIYYDENDSRIATRVNYLKNNEVYNYFWKYEDYSIKRDLGYSNTSWKRSSTVFYDSEKHIPGLTKTLYSPGRYYDVVTHEYLGEYLRFLRDYYSINLMSLYNCFNATICNNINYKSNKIINSEFNKNLIESQNNTLLLETSPYKVFDAQDSNYKIYAIPVKLFSDYTIAIDSYQGIEMFCGLYSTNIEDSEKAEYLFAKTYQKFSKTIFSQPFLYDKLNVKYWTRENEICVKSVQKVETLQLNNKIMSRWDLVNREQDLKLFIKVPTSCNSSIVILEGDFRTFNDSKYTPVNGILKYKQNHSAVNLDKLSINEFNFKPISKLQLLEFNTGESYPFADRLLEYLIGSAVTPIDEISDNIVRAQRVMKQNQHYFKIEGIWENKMQKIIYDYSMNPKPLPIKVIDNNLKLVDEHIGYYSRFGHTPKSSLYDVLGYIDKDAEKWYASWKKDDSKVNVQDNIQNIDIYNGLYDI